MRSTIRRRAGRTLLVPWVLASGLAALAAGCGSIQVLGDGGAGSGTGGSATGAGGNQTGTGGRATGAGGSNGGTGGTAAGTGGRTGTGGRAGTGGRIGTGGGIGIPDAGADLPVDRGPCVCPAIFDPVCGVDGMTYSNPCTAQCAGVAVAHQGACGDAGRCVSAGAGCCGSNGDCPGLQECANASCGTAAARGNGVCKMRPAVGSGTCWTDADCPNGGVCNGAQVCRCDMQCLVADKVGTCVF